MYTCAVHNATSIVNVLNIACILDILILPFMKKNIDLPPEIVKILTHEAVDAGKDFKNYVQDLLIEAAKKSKYFK